MTRSSVCNGAILSCSLGSVPSPLVVVRQSASAEAAQAIAAISDSRPLENILPFGICAAATHPLAATLAAPCVPQTSELWSQRTPSVRYHGQVALRQDATLACAYGGVVSVVQPIHMSTSLSERGT